MNKKSSSVLLLVLASTACLHAQDSPLVAASRTARAKAEQKKSDSPWYKPTRVTLHEETQGVNATMSFEMDANDDMKISVNSTDQDGRSEKGEIMLINGKCQWMLAKGTPLEKGQEIDALDVPVLSLELVTELLRAALPDGPAGIKEKKAFHIERKDSIHVNTLSAEGGLEGPWALDGTIEPAGENQWAFDLTFSHDQASHVTGTWQKTPQAPLFADTTPLQGWKVFGVGPIKIVDGRSTIFDYGAQPSVLRPKTLGDLRMMAAK